MALPSSQRAGGDRPLLPCPLPLAWRPRLHCVAQAASQLHTGPASPPSRPPQRAVLDHTTPIQLLHLDVF